MLHTIQANDVIPILPPAVGWVAAATVVTEAAAAILSWGGEVSHTT